MSEAMFDQTIERKLTGCRKWDGAGIMFGCNDVLPMWIADMDFTAPPAVVEAVCRRAAHGVYGYPVRSGAYFQVIIDWLKQRQAWAVEADWICHTPGVVPAIGVAVQTFTQPGDGIIIQPPVYPPFFACVKGNGRRIVENPLILENGRYVMDFDDLEAKITPDVKMIIISSPHNPVGRVWTRQELARLADICVKHHIIMVSDEIHGDLIFPGFQQIPLASVSPAAASLTITCIAPSKTFNIAGLSTSSIIISDRSLRERFNRALEALDITGGNVFGMVALEAAYRHGARWLAGLLEYLDGNAAFITRFIRERIPQIQVTPPESTFLAWFDFRALGLDADELRQFLVNKARIGLNDGRTFGSQGEGFARINFGCPRSVVEEALARLETAVRSERRS